VKDINYWESESARSEEDKSLIHKNVWNFIHKTMNLLKKEEEML